MRKVTAESIRERIYLSAHAARLKAAAAFSKEDFLNISAPHLVRAFITHAEALAQSLADIVVAEAASLARHCPEHGEIFSAAASRVLQDMLKGFEAECTGGLGIAEGLLASVIGDSYKKELATKASNTIQLLVDGQASVARLAWLQALDGNMTPGTPKAGMPPEAPTEVSNPREDPRYIGLAAASMEFNIPRSNLSKAARKPPGAPGYLWSTTEGRNRYFRRADLRILARSREGYLRRRPKDLS